MLIAANVGNSVISIGFFDDGCKLCTSFKISTDIKRTSDEYLAIITGIASNLNVDKNNINGAIISSVVPQLTQKLKDTLLSFTGVEPLTVGPGVKTGFHIKIDNPSELGGDIVANTAAAVHIKNENKCTIVADIGAVNTVSAISKNGEYLGCCIFPGIQLSFETLHGNTAQLPNVNLLNSVKAIGKNSQESICSGVILGNALTVDGFVEKFAAEMRCKVQDIDLIATGEYANAVLKECKYSFDVDEYLTLKGLYHIYKNTTKA